MPLPVALIAVVGLTSTASAAEVQFEGFYRGRARAFDTLSLDRGSPQSEGLSAFAEHRLWLRPRFLLSDQVGLFTEIRGLDNVLWGDEVTSYTNYGDIESTLFDYGLNAPTSATEGGAPLLDITLWRVWGEVHTDVGRFTFGRVPLHWGVGMWLNDGVSVDTPFADHGDTTDRVMWELLVQEQFYLRLAVDVPAERFVGFEDDTMAFNAAAAYRTEEITAGLLVQLDHTGQRQNTGSLNVFTVDGAVDATLGKLHGAAEVVGHFGGGDLEGGLNDASITAVGAAIHADMDLDPWQLGIRTGLATGDGEPNDLNLRRYTFDRDYSLGLFMFEQPMPVLSSAIAAANDVNGGRETDVVITGPALSNALFIRGAIKRRIVEGFSAEVSYLGARTAKAPKVGGTNSSRSYGNEFGVGVSFLGIEHLEVDGRFGVLLPGSVYSVGANDLTELTGYDDPVFGFQLSSRISF